MLIDLKLWRRTLVLAGPLILSTTGHMLMQFIDALFLARHSEEAIAAVGPASMTSFCVGSLVMGAVGYTSVLAAQYHGAGQNEKIGPAVWQGIKLALVAAVGFVGIAFLGKHLFAFIDHEPLVQQYEREYFQIVCASLGVSFVGVSISGLFSGLGRTRTIMFVQLSSVAINIVLDYLLIFGKFGFPAWGVRGAAVATVIAHVAGAIAFIVLFLCPSMREKYGTWHGRKWDGEMMWRLIRFGIPNGFRFFIELTAWTLFLFFVGRIGTTELAATTIAWRINGLTFFPLIGLSEAVRILVGQSQGRNDVEHSAHVAKQGTILAEMWMLFGAALFLLFPRQWYQLFQGTDAADSLVTAQGVILLRFVAAYCLLDGVNIVLAGALMAAGDTRWTFWMSLATHGAYIGALVVADALDAGLYAEWTCATVFVLTIALFFIYRFQSGHWKRIKVIETAPP